MNLNLEQLKMIGSYFEEEGLKDQLLIDDLSDHLSCKTETYMSSEGLPFLEASALAKKECFPNGPKEFERDLKLLTTKKPNTMIKKLAFIGGYASALCLCLAILFFTLSSLTRKKTELRVNSVRQEWRLSHENYNDFYGSDVEKELGRFEATLYVTTYNRYVFGETLLILSVIILISTFLPYQFYSKYQKHDLTILQA